MTREDAIEVLRLDVPTTPNALKSAYRRRAFEEHPDRSRHPHAADRFMDVQKAFALLDGDAEVVVGLPAEARLDDGTLLSELGLGLGPTINGKPCPSCRGKGYRAVNKRVPCPDCRAIGFFVQAFRCRRCNGTGRFTRNNRDVGECFACSGLGWKTAPRFAECSTCHGTHLATSTTIAAYYRCDGCSGTGEIVVLNPVLPKGLFTAGLAAASRTPRKG